MSAEPDVLSQLRSELSQLREQVSKLSELEIRRQQAEEHFKQLFESSPVGIYIVQNQRFKLVNPAFQKLTDYSAEELLHKHPLELVHPEDREFVRENAIKMLRGERTLPYRYRTITKRGNVKWILETVTSVHYEGTRASLGNFMDNTELIVTEQALRSERDLARQYLEIAGTMIVALDSNGLVTLINRRGCEILGYEQDEILGKNWFDNFLPESTRERDREAFQRLLSAEADESAHLESPVFTRDGTERVIIWTNRSLIDPTGKVCGVLASGQDITENKRIAEQLRRKTEVMERDLDTARLIQRAMLPAELPQTDHLEIAYRYIPLEAVGGDYFSVIPLREGGLAVLLADVAGHGVTASLFLSLIKFIADRVCRRYAREPENFLRALNAELIDNMPFSFVTSIYGIFDPADHAGTTTFRFAVGGHPPPIVHLRSDDKFYLVKAKGRALGMFKDYAVREFFLRLRSGDRIFLYSDGIPETIARKSDFSGYNQLTAIVEKASKDSVRETLDSILSEVERIKGDEPFVDDIVILAIEVR